MRTRFIMLCWLAAVVLLAWPVQMRVLGTDIGCGPSAVAFYRELVPSGDFLERATDSACAGRSYGYVAAAAGLVVGGPLLAGLGWRARRRRRRAQSKAAKVGRKAMQQPAPPDRTAAKLDELRQP